MVSRRHGVVRREHRHLAPYLTPKLDASRRGRAAYSTGAPTEGLTYPRSGSPDARVGVRWFPQPKLAKEGRATWGPEFTRCKCSLTDSTKSEPIWGATLRRGAVLLS